MQRERHGWPRTACLLIALFVVASCAAIAIAAPGSTRRPAPPPRTVAPVQTATPLKASTPIKSTAGEAQWIWHSSFRKDEVPPGTCYFRHTFDLEFPERGRIEITCDNRFELWVNGRRVGASTDWHVLEVYEIDKLLVRGRNVIAVKCENETKGTAALAARVVIRQSGGTDVSYSTGGRWKASLNVNSGWQRAGYDDSQWTAAKSYGPLGRTPPWNNGAVAADGSGGARFVINSEFRVEQVLDPDQTGSMLGLVFNEFGEILASRERGPLLIITDSNGDGIHDTVNVYCDKVKNCQGILPLNGEVFVVGEGPDGAGLYRLTDNDQDRKIDDVKTVLKFNGGIGEHGPHCLRLGPDGFLYVMLGNHAQVASPYSELSPLKQVYEGDLLTPKYEDANGTATGVKAPCGTILRTTTTGDSVELYAGGLRNAYGMTFTHDGELITFDSDMEWDVGLPWYRPTRLLHVLPAGEFGSRSGWSPWPNYYVDGLPPIYEAGRGSPTGMASYDHYQFPVRFHDAIFAGDWSQGKILALRIKKEGASYTVKSEDFLTGRPLNVVDLAVGPDGWLYFVTGGRGTEGGLYRIVWQGKVPPRERLTGVMRAVRQPQLDSAWSRQHIAEMQQQLGAQWDTELVDLAEDGKAAEADRVRALDLMQLFGPSPSSEMLAKLATDAQAGVRARTAMLMGLHPADSLKTDLEQMLADQDPLVRRQACEAAVRGGYQLSAERLIPLLADPNRFVAWSARRAIERLPVDTWQQQVLESSNVRTFVVGSTALLIAAPTPEVARTIVSRTQELMKGFVSDPDFVDMLRVLELAMIRGPIPASELPDLRTDLVGEYPAKDFTINRELVRLLARLQASEIIPQALVELEGRAPEEEKLHLSMCLRFIESGWTAGQKLKLLTYWEAARKTEGVGHSYSGYIDNVARDFCAPMDLEARMRVLEQASKLPAMSLNVLASMSGAVPPDIVERAITLDAELDHVKTDEAKQLQTGIVAVLAEADDSRAMTHLREVFEQSPERREELAMGLAQAPAGENWPLLVRALPILRGAAAQEVMTKLAAVDRKPEVPGPIRQTILCALRMTDEELPAALKLLEEWTGQHPAGAGVEKKDALVAWQKWFATTYPGEQDATLPTDPQNAAWNFQELLDYLNSPTAVAGSPDRGAKVFEKALCIKCHRFGGRGDAIGPDLTTVAQRFQKREILESILFPSQVISDQYPCLTVTTTDGRSFTGMVGSGSDGITLLQSTGEKIRLRKADIDQMQPSKKSAMPDGLLNSLSQDDISDLFAFLTQRTSSAQPSAPNAPTADAAPAEPQRIGPAPRTTSAIPDVNGPAVRAARTPTGTLAPPPPPPLNSARRRQPAIR